MRARRRRPAPYIHLGYVLQPSPALARPQRATRGRPHRLRSTLRVAYGRSDSAHRLGHWQSARRYPVPEYLKPAPAFPERLATRKIHSAFRRTAILGREKQRQISSVRGFFSGLHCVTLETNDGGAPGQPAANAFNHDRVPARNTPSPTAPSSASGIDADEVLPCWSTVTSIRSRGSPSLRQVPCIMRIFAWWGISQSICAALMRALSSASSATFSRRWTASLKTAWPSIVTNA